MNLGTFTHVSAGHYTMTVDACAASFDLDRVRRSEGQLCGELTVKCSLAGAKVVGDGILSSSEFNCSAQQSRSTRAKYLSERAQTQGQVDWVGLLEEFCVRAIDFDRQGEGRVWLKDVESPERGEDFTVNGLRLVSNLPAMIFGDSGKGKSMLAAYLGGLLVIGGRTVLYADWEFAGDQHADRVRRMFGTVPDNFGYVRCDRPLIHEVDRLRRIIRRDGFDYIICDSVAFAAAGAPEAAEAAQGYYQSLRQLEIGSLNVAHITKGQTGDQQDQKRQESKPFGSTFWAAGARAMWFFQSTDTPDGFALALHPKKSNDGAPGRAVGFQFQFADNFGPIQVSSTDVRDHGDLAASLPVWQQMQQLVKRGPMSMSQIAAELDVPVNTISHTVRRKDRMFIRLLGSDGIAKIGLKALGDTCPGT